VGDAAIVHRHVTDNPALPTKAQPQFTHADLHVTPAQRGQAERAVAARRFVVADALQGGVEQVHDRGDNGDACQRVTHRLGKIATDGGADARQHGPELAQSLELTAAPRPLPFGVVTVPLAAPRVAAGRLQVTVGARADPDLRVGGRNRQRADAGQFRGIAQWPAVGRAVGEPFSATPPADYRTPCR
jgi:hypothetical protein